jgi:T5SS/PEP-CTERM-associated repeat protein
MMQLASCGGWLSIAALWLGIATQSHAEDKLWDGGAPPAGLDGIFSDSANWNSFIPPRANDIAHFGTSVGNIFQNGYTVSFTTSPTNQALVVEDDNVTFDLDGHLYTTTAAVPITLGVAQPFTFLSGGLNITDGTVAAPFESNVLVGAGRTGFLTVGTRGLLLGTANIYVGYSSNGTFTVSNNGDVIANDVIMSRVVGATSTATITGPGSSLLAADLVVGEFGTSTLNITSGADVDSDPAIIGRFGSSSGTVHVRDASSTWDVSGQLIVGYEARGMPGVVAGGTLVISAGGMVESGSGVVAYEVNSTGKVTIDGTFGPSAWINSGSLVVGDSGQATLEILAGGQLESGRAFLGFGSDGPAGSGDVAVSGLGSHWTNSGDMEVGFGQATLHISDNAQVHSGRLFVSVDSTEPVINITSGGQLHTAGAIIAQTFGLPNSVISLSGTGSAWMNSGDLLLGGGGNGILRITGGAQVHNMNSFVGSEPENFAGSGRGDVRVSGAESLWMNSGDVFIGFGHEGSLTITAGAKVHSDGEIFVSSDGTVSVTRGSELHSKGGSAGFGFGGGGEILVSGRNSRWINTGRLSVGNFGPGTLEINAAGLVETIDAFISGYDDELPGNSPGTVTVSGVDSRWTISGDLYVGFHAQDTLNIAANGQVHTAGRMAVGRGQAGTGSVNITTGGQLHSGEATVALPFGSNANVTVGGAGSLWTIDGRLSQGGNLDSGVNGPVATLRIQPGAIVAVAQSTHLWDDDSLILEGGTLSTSEIRFRGPIGFNRFVWTSGTLHVGFFDGASLDVPNGGVLAPGNSAGTTTIRGDYASLSGATTEIEIGGTQIGVEYDVINVFNNAILMGGNLELKLINGFVPSTVDKFNILQVAGNISGAYDNVANGQRLVTSDGLGSFLVHYGAASAFNPRQIVLSNFLAGLPGDFSGDGLVNAVDIDLLASAAHNDADDFLYDLNGDGTVNFAVGQPNAENPSDSDALIYEILQTRYGDADLNRQVFLTDLTWLATNYRQAGPFGWAQGNFNGSQEAGTSASPRVFLSDLTLLATNWRFGVSGSGASVGAAVPEPAAAHLALGIGCIALARPERAVRRYYG